MARKGGGAYLIGVHKPDAPINVDVLADLITNQVTVKGVYMGSTNIKHDIPMYAQLYLQGRFDLDDLISREINISEINDAYEELKKGAIARSVIGIVDLADRSEEHTSELQSLMRISYAVFCLNTKK